MKKIYTIKSFMAIALMALFGLQANAADVTFNFNTLEVGTSSSESQDGDINENFVLTQDGITLTVSPKEEDKSNANRFWSTSNGPQLRCYSGTITLSASEAITGVTFGINNSKFNLTPSTGTIGDNKAWSGSATEIVFTVGGNTQLNSITVTTGGSSTTPDTPDTPDTPSDLTKVDNIAAFKALESGTEAVLTLTNAQVLYAGSRDIFVKDATGAIDFYNTGLELTANQVLNGTIVGKYSPFKNMPELAKGDNFTSSITTTAGNAATPYEIGLDEISMAYACDLITVKNLTITKDGNNIYGVSEDGDQIQIYDKFGIKYTVEEGSTYTITGILVPYNEAFEIAPISDFTSGSDIPDTPETEGVIFSEPFSESLGEFTVEGTIPEGLSYVWTFDSRYGAKASAFANSTSYAADVYLVSPLIDMTSTNTATLTFEHAANHFVSLADEVSVNIRQENGNWEKLTVDVYPTGWTFVTATIDLTAYAGKKVQLGFRYTSTETTSATWEIKNVVVTGNGGTTPIQPIEKVKFVKTNKIESGKSYLIAAATDEAASTYAVAKLVTSNYGYLKVDEATLSDGAISLEDETNAFVIEDVNGSYTIKQSDGRYLFQKGTFNSFNADAAPEEGQYWSIDFNADGTAKITNLSVSKYVQYSTGYTSFGSYADEQGILPTLFVKSENSGIKTIAVENDANAPVYNLQGQRVNTTLKGIYIQNGRKFIVK